MIAIVADVGNKAQMLNEKVSSVWVSVDTMLSDLPPISKDFMNAAERVIAIDVETTGLLPLRGDRVIEVGAVALQGGIIVEEFHRLINSGARITIAAQRIHGITSDMLAGQPAPDEVFPKLQEFIGGSILIAHNAPFDMQFLRAEFGRLGRSFSSKHTCTLALSRRRFPGLPDYRLEAVYRHLFGVIPELTKRHRALDDAMMAARIWMEMTRS